MVSVKETEQIGNALNMLEALNGMLLRLNKRNYTAIRKVFISLKIDKVIEFIDGVVC